MPAHSLFGPKYAPELYFLMFIADILASWFSLVFGKFLLPTYGYFTCFTICGAFNVASFIVGIFIKEKHDWLANRQ